MLFNYAVMTVEKMTSFTISQIKENFPQEERDQSVSTVYNDICIWDNLINCRWLKILILNYLTSPSCLRCFPSHSCFSDLKTILEHLSSRLCFLNFFLVTYICLPSVLKLCFTASSQFCSCVPSLTQPFAPILEISPPRLHVFWDTHE